MANEDEFPPSSSGEDEGGPVKSFLDHLEDLRWVLSVCGVDHSLIACLADGA